MKTYYRHGKCPTSESMTTQSYLRFTRTKFKRCACKRSARSQRDTWKQRGFASVRTTQVHQSTHISNTTEVTFVGRVTQHRQTGRYILKDCPLMSSFRDHLNWMVSERTGPHVLGFDEQHVGTHLKDRHKTLIMSRLTTRNWAHISTKYKIICSILTVKTSGKSFRVVTTSKSVLVRRVQWNTSLETTRRNLVRRRVCVRDLVFMCQIQKRRSARAQLPDVRM